jgi:hypothetical protein
MGPANTSPIHSEFGLVLPTSIRYLGNVRNALAEVELNILLGVKALDFDEGGMVVLVT